MKSSSQSSRNVVIVAIVLIVLGVVYFYFEGGTAPAGIGSLLSGVPSTAGGVGSAELTLLNQIQSLKIDTTLFSNPSYATLRDYSQPIPTQAVGRPNPFAPFPGSPSTSGSER